VNVRYEIELAGLNQVSGMSASGAEAQWEGDGKPGSPPRSLIAPLRRAS
jgi:hypothetical protein